jgi:hypothetical protein
MTDGDFLGKRRFQDGDAQLDNAAGELERMDRDRAGQSGDIEGLSLQCADSKRR